MPAPFDVLIIGAGAAGLAAARDLSGSGKRICLIEARPRIGGRVHTLHVPGLPLPIELGAEFIHGEAEASFAIVDAAGLLTYEIPAHQWRSRDGVWELIHDFWSEIDRVRARIRRLKRDRSFAEFLRTQRFPPRVRELALGFVEGYHASHADRISAQALATSDDEQDDPSGTKQFRIASGYDSLLSWLRAGLHPDRTELLLGCVATRVEWSTSRGVAVDCRIGKIERTIRAHKAIVTLPIGVWKAPREQAGTIRFDPLLREKEQVLEKVEVGHVVKIAFHFRERFWDRADFLEERSTGKESEGGRPWTFLQSNDGFPPTWWNMAPVRAPLLTGWAGGHAADALLAEGDRSMVDRALDSMSRAFRMPRRELDSLLIHAHFHNWQADPFSRGAYSYAGVGGKNAHAALARPIGGVLFFAGEATTGDETGTVAGAIGTGQRAAREIMRTG